MIDLKIGNEGQNPCIDPIQEVDSFERENNESFLHENNYLFDNFLDGTNSVEVNSSTGLPSDLLKCDLTSDENDLSKMRRNLISLKLSKTNNNHNKSDYNINLNSNSGEKTKKPFFVVNNINSFNNHNNTNTKLNQSCNLTLENKRRGRKKILFDGVKTEIIDKAFLREFKSFVKKSKHLLRNIFDDLKAEEKVFWNEFLLSGNPPLYFAQGNQIVEYKSFGKNLLKFIFSHPSVRQLYTIFVKQKGKEIVNLVVNKKIKKIDRKMLLFYSFYGKNLHKLYSNDYNLSDLNIDELEGLYLSTGLSSTSDSITINTSIQN